MSILSYLPLICFFALPVASVIWLIVSLAGFFIVRPRREEEPERYRSWRKSLIASAVVTGILALFLLGIVLLFAAAVSHM